METSSPEGITIMDKDESSEKAYHIVDGFVIEDSKSPFPVSSHNNKKRVPLLMINDGEIPQ